MISFMLPFVDRLFPECRFIHMVRDGRAVAASYSEKELEKMKRLWRPGHSLPPSHRELLMQMATHWEQHLIEIERQRIALSLSPERYLEVRYEDLCEEPSQNLERITQFLNLDAADFSGERETFRNMNFKYRQQVSAEDLVILKKQIGGTLVDKGYS
jgi:hypothetical protein